MIIIFFCGGVAEKKKLTTPATIAFFCGGVAEEKKIGTWGAKCGSVKIEN